MSLGMSSGGLASGGVPQPQGGVADQNPYAALAGSAGPAASNLTGQAFQPNVQSLTPGLQQANQQYQSTVFGSQPGQFAPPKMSSADLLGGGLTSLNPDTGLAYGADLNIIDPATGLPRGYVQGQGFAPVTMPTYNPGDISMPVFGGMDNGNPYMNPELMLGKPAYTEEMAQRGETFVPGQMAPQPKPADLSLPGPGFFSPPPQLTKEQPTLTINQAGGLPGLQAPQAVSAPQPVIGAGQVLDQMPQARPVAAAPRIAPRPQPQAAPRPQARPIAQPQRNIPRPVPQPARRVQAQPVRRPMPVRGLR